MPSSPTKTITLDADIIAAPTELTFSQALDEVLEKKRITRKVWGDKRHYGLLKDGLLQLHKSGEEEESTHPWIINDGDIAGNDWITL